MENRQETSYTFQMKREQFLPLQRRVKLSRRTLKGQQGSLWLLSSWKPYLKGHKTTAKLPLAKNLTTDTLQGT